LDIKNADSIFYNIGVIKDKYPIINISEEVDSTNSLKRFIEGRISDDYGFRSLTARINITSKDSTYSVNKAIKISSTGGSQLFSFSLDISDYKLKPGDKLDYTFIVTDND